MSCFTSITPRVWLRNTRNRFEIRTSIDDGWINDSSSGSMTIRPAASCSRRVRSERITNRHVSDRRPIATLWACTGRPRSTSRNSHVMLDMVDQAAFGHLVTTGPDGFASTSLPFLVDRSAGSIGHLRGHVATSEPALADDRRRIDARDLPARRRLREPVVVPVEGRARQGRADVELRARARPRHRAGPRRPGVGAHARLRV